MKIIIDKDHFPKIKEALDAVQERSRTRTISPDTIVEACHEAFHKMYCIYEIPGKHLTGMQIEYDAWAQRFPRAYKWTPMSTQFTAVYGGRKWYLTDVRREATKPESGKLRIILPDAAREELIKRFSR